MDLLEDTLMIAGQAVGTSMTGVVLVGTLVALLVLKNLIEVGVWMKKLSDKRHGVATDEDMLLKLAARIRDLHETVEREPAGVPGGRLVWRDPEVTKLLKNQEKMHKATVNTLEAIQRSLAELHTKQDSLDESQAALAQVVLKKA